MNVTACVSVSVSVSVSVGVSVTVNIRIESKEIKGETCVCVCVCVYVCAGLLNCHEPHQYVCMSLMPRRGQLIRPVTCRTPTNNAILSQP